MMLQPIATAIQASNTLSRLHPFRMNGVAWSGEQALLIDESYHLASYDLASGKLAVRTRVNGATGPIRVGAMGRVFVCCAEEVYEVLSNGSLSRLFSVGYEIMSMAVLRDEVWVGGNGLDRFNLATEQVLNLEPRRDLPILQIASNYEADLVAAAGGTICLYHRGGRLLTSFGEALFRCQFSESNVLFTLTQVGNSSSSCHWNRSQASELDVCTFTDCTSFHCYGEVGHEKVIVSSDGRLFFFDCLFDEAGRS